MPLLKYFRLLSLGLFLALGVACGGGGGGGGESSGGGGPVPGPIASSLSAAASSITSGTSTTLTPVFSNGTGVITPGNIAATSGIAITVSPTTTTTYTLTVTNTLGATATTTATVTVVPMPVATSLTAGSTTINAGSSTSLTAVFSDGTGVITPGNTAVISGTAITVSPTTTTTYTLTVTNSLGATATKTTTITVVVAPPNATSLTAAASTIAIGSSTTLTPVFSNGTGVITPGNIAATSGTAITVSPTTTTTYTLTVTNIAGATATKTTTITVLGLPKIISFNLPTQILTPGDEFTVTPVFEGTFGIINPGGIRVQSGQTVKIKALGGITYTLTVTNDPGTLSNTPTVFGGMESQDTAGSFSSTSTSGSITTSADPASPSITSFTTPNLTVPAGQTISLSAVFSEGAGVITPGNLNILSDGSVNVTPLANTIYTLTVTNAIGKQATATLNINVGNPSTEPNPVITSFSTSAKAATVTVGSSTTLTAVFSNGTGIITPGNLPILSGVPLTISPAIPTTYTLTVSNGAGVKTSNLIGIEVLSPPRIISFNASSNLVPVSSPVGLTATFSDGNGTLTPGNLSVYNGQTVTVLPASDTLYTLTVTNAAGTSVTATQAVQVVSAAYIVDFKSSASTITLGDSVTLSSVFYNGTGVITPGNIAVPLNTGSVVVTPVATTTYTLTVTQSNGAFSSKSLTVTVLPKQTTILSNKLKQRRYIHTSTLLSDGRVLIAGGYQGPDPVTGALGPGAMSFAEIFDPKTNSFTALPNMPQSMRFHAASLLKNDLVLIANGSTNGDATGQGQNLSTSQLFNPFTNTWSLGPDTARPFDFNVTNQSILLDSGKVIYVMPDQIQIYDPATNTFTLGPPLKKRRRDAVATLLSDQTILITGGLGASLDTVHKTASTYCEIYDPVTNTISVKGQLEYTRENHAAALLPNGNVLILGGYNDFQGMSGDGGVRPVEIFDPSTGQSQVITQLSVGLAGPKVVALPNQNILIHGGVYDSSTPALNGYRGVSKKVFLFSPTTKILQELSPLNVPRYGFGSTLMNNGKVLITGGGTDVPTPITAGMVPGSYVSIDSAELFDPLDATIPSITSFVSDKTTFTSGGTVTLTPMFTNGTGVINNGVGAVTSGTAYVVSPTAETTFTLTVTGSTGIKTNQKVTVFTAPVVTSLTPNSTAITSGSSVDLTPVFANGEGFITPGNIRVISGASVRVTPSATTTYTLTVTNRLGTQASTTTTITVASAPVITSFSSSVVKITSGKTVQLTPIFSGGTGIISPGNISATSGVAVTVSPTKDTIYKLTVANSLEIVAESTVGIQVIAAPVASLTVNTPTINAGDSVMLTPVWTGGKAKLALVQEIEQSPSIPITSGVPVSVTPPLPSSIYALRVSNELGDSSTVFTEITMGMTTTTLGDLSESRSSHSATLLPNGKVLIAGGGGGGILYDMQTKKFTATGNLLNFRVSHSSTLLPNGKVLIAGGSWAGVVLRSAELYDPVTGTFSATGNLATGRVNHTSTLLPNGKVLVTGGATNTAELYDPSSGTWSNTPTMSTQRQWATATLLPNGTVLVAGGTTASAQIFDPTNNSWSSAGTMSESRYSHTATLLPNGKVLIAGGNNGGGIIATAEIFDPSNGTWTSAVEMGTQRQEHTATLLPNGNVLVAGGLGIVGALTSYEVYDSTTNRWTPGANLSVGSYTAGILAQPRFRHTATLLSDGTILFCGGVGAPGNTAEIFKLALITSPLWTSATSLPFALDSHAATLLPNGKILLTGGMTWINNTGAGNDDSQIYDYQARTWTSTGSTSIVNRSYPTTTLLPNGKVLVAGGGSPITNAAKLYDPSSNLWSSAGTMTLASRDRHTATLLPNGKVLVVGGRISDAGSESSAELYDPLTNAWASTGSLSTARWAHTATLLSSGLVLVVGGRGSTEVLGAELYNPSTGVWTGAQSLTQSPGARWGHTATLLPNGKVLIAGGLPAANTLYENTNSATKMAMLYNPSTNSWSGAGEMSQGRYLHTATLLPNGKVLIAGGKTSGSNSNSSLATCELYDPDTNTWSNANNLLNPRSSHTATILPNGKIFIVGGYHEGKSTATSEIYQLYYTSPSLIAAPALISNGSSTTLLPDFNENDIGLLNGSTVRPGQNITVRPTTSRIYQLKVTNPGGFNFDRQASVTVVNTPVITLFQREDSTFSKILLGSSITLTGFFRYGAGVISPGNIQVEPDKQFFIQVSPSTSTTYTLTVTNQFGVATTRTTSIEVVSSGGPTITSFTADRPVITRDSAVTVTPVFNGGSAAISWRQADGRRSGGMGSLESGVGRVLTLDYDTTLILRVNDSDGIGVTRSLQIGVVDPPTAQLLAAETVLPVGSSTTITPFFTNGSGVINPGNIAATTGIPIAVTPNTSTKYSLVVKNSSGFEANAQASIMVGTPFNYVGPMVDQRFAAVSTVLPNGKILVAGGISSDTNLFLNSAEIYDPNTGIWTSTGSMKETRAYATATLLSDGKVLVAGGWAMPKNGNNYYYASAELYDPSLGTWTAAGSMSVAHYSHTATILPNGKILVVGGLTGTTGQSNTVGSQTSLSTTELYDPNTNTWSPSGALSQTRNQHTATLLPSGKVIIVGGQGSQSLVEIYNPSTGTWASTGSLQSGRMGHTTTLLPNGKILVTGGTTFGTGSSFAVLSSVEIYDPSLETWSYASPMIEARRFHTASVLPSGKILIVGGSSGTASSHTLLASSEFYDPDTNTWSLGSPMPTPRFLHSSTLLRNGHVLIYTGKNQTTLSIPNEGRSLVFSMPPAANSDIWSAGKSLARHRNSHTLTSLPNGEVLMAGGYREPRDYDEDSIEAYPSGAELYSPSSNLWSSAGTMVQRRTYHSATLLKNGKVLVVGGYNYIPTSKDVYEQKPSNTSEVYDPITKTWSTTGSMKVSRVGHTSTLLPDGKVLVVGGGTTLVELYDPETATWSFADTPLDPREYDHTATLLGNGKVLISGGRTGNKWLATSNLYNSLTGRWTSAGAMSTARTGASAILLPNGKVLVSGGVNRTTNPPIKDNYLTSSELFNPDSETWSPTGSLLENRAGHKSLLLPNGLILLTDGWTSISDLSVTPQQSMIFDPNKETWTWTGNIDVRTASEPSLMSNGLVLRAGGYNGNAGGDRARPLTAVLYQPSYGFFTPYVAPPKATSLLAGNSAITLGDFTTLTPIFSNGTGKIGTSAGGSDVSSSINSGASISVSPTLSTTYYLTVTNSAGTTASTSTTISVVAAPVISSLTASANAITFGETLTLTPIFSGGVGIITPGSISVISGTSINVSPSLTTLYTLTVTNALGARASTTVNVTVNRSFSPMASMASSRYRHTETLLPNGQVLVAGGDANVGTLASSELFDPVGSSWSKGGDLASARNLHTANLLPNGKVLVTGGAGDSALSVFKSSSELYNPITNTWSSTGSLAVERYRHTATLLTNGKILVAGGNNSNTLSSAELYDPNTGTWSSSGSMSVARWGHTATLLPNGKVLVVGGSSTVSGAPLSSAEIFNPVSGTWSTARSALTARYRHTATLLSNGKVLVVGGTSTSILSSAEVYDFQTDTWSTTASLSTARFLHTSSLLPNGLVLIAGGDGTTGTLNFAELYDPFTKTWSKTGSLVNARRRHTATLLSNGMVLMVGGYAGTSILSSTEIFTITSPLTSGQWSETGSMSRDRFGGSGALLYDGTVLVSGGQWFSSAELYNPQTKTWSLTGSMTQSRGGHISTVLPNGLVLVTGGMDGGLAELYDPKTKTWSATGTMMEKRGGEYAGSHTATVLPSGKVLVTGGSVWGVGTTLATSEIYDPNSESWSQAKSMSTARRWHSAVLLPNGKVLVAGGIAGSSGYPDIKSAEIYDPQTDTWTSTGSMSVARATPAVLLPNGKVLLAGGGAWPDTGTAEIYDPDSGTWSNAGRLSEERQGPRAFRLPNGKVMVTGGWYPNATSELYDWVSNTWSTTGTKMVNRRSEVALVLPDGSAFVAGGTSADTALASAEVYSTSYDTTFNNPLLVTADAIITVGSSTSLTPFYSGGTAKIGMTLGGSEITSSAVNEKPLSVSPTSTTTYYLTVTNSKGTTASTTASITVVPAPVITSFTPSSISITSGTSTTLIPVFSNGIGVITPGNLNVTSGTAVTLNPTTTTSYTLKVTNAAGQSISKDSLITVVPAPIATSLTPNASIITIGNSTKLTPVFTAGTAKIGTTLGGGDISTTLTTDVPLDVTPLATTTYYLTVTNSLGATASKSTTVTVVAAPVATSLTPGATSIAMGSSTTLNPVFSGGVGKIGTIPGGKDITDSAISGAALNVTPSNTTTYYLTVTNSAGTVASTSTSISVLNKFTTTGGMTSRRSSHSLNLLPNGQVVVVGGLDGGIRLSSFELYDPSRGIWHTSGSLSMSRHSHTATLLSSGKLLVVGGVGPSNTLSSVELYDPSLGTWSATGSLTTSRQAHTATLLSSGKVLVVGGSGSNDALSSAELYDPSLGTWSATGSLTKGRWGHTATLLPNGKVLVVGGYDPNSGYISSTELYDPSTGTFANTGSPSVARSGHTATLLPSGDVLVAGGYNTQFVPNSLSLCELYDPLTEKWRSASPLSQHRRQHTATLLPNGKVLVVGGFGFNTSNDGSVVNRASAEIYDPSVGIGGTWSTSGSLETGRAGSRAILLPNGQVLIVGGTQNINNAAYSLNQSEIFNMVSPNNALTWSATQSLSIARQAASGTLLPNGTVLTSGGQWHASSEVYDPKSRTWSATGSMSTNRGGHTSLLLPNGKVLAVGGDATTELYNPATRTWSMTGSMAQSRLGAWAGSHTMTLLPNGKVLVTGGTSSNGSTLASAELYDPSSGTWSSAGSMATARRWHSAALLPKGKVLIAGGNSTGSGYPDIRSAELYDPQNNTWSTTGSMTVARSTPAILLPNGKVLLAGGGAWPDIASSELYNHETGTWSNGARMLVERQSPSVILLPNGKVLAMGGWYPNSRSELYDPESNTWKETGALMVNRRSNILLILPDGTVLVAGGIDTSTDLSSAEIYSIKFE